jgi:hypothetical protein
MATEGEIRAQIAFLQAQLNDLHPVAEPPHSLASTDRTSVNETAQQTTITTTHTPPTEATFPPGGKSGKSGKIAVRSSLVQPRSSQQTPEEIVAAITSLKSLIISGVDSAGYGDKRTEFRSLTDLRQILNGLEDDLSEALGLSRGRVRQIRMTTAADKGL